MCTSEADLPIVPAQQALLLPTEQPWGTQVALWEDPLQKPSQGAAVAHEHAAPAVRLEPVKS